MAVADCEVGHREHGVGRDEARKGMKKFLNKRERRQRREQLKPPNVPIPSVLRATVRRGAGCRCAVVRRRGLR